MVNIDNQQDVLDSRDILERITELESYEADPEGNRADLKDDECNALMLGDLSDAQLENLALLSSSFPTSSQFEARELLTLRGLIEEAEGCGGERARDGILMIRDTYFKEYAQELAEDIGAISRDMQWPLDCIDWDQAARELQNDYSSVDFDGMDYWVRS